MTVANKIIYGNNTLIDLTGDTATASDVASGKTFHLASGEQATGTLSASMKTKTATPTNSRQISFTGLESEPTSFVVIHTDSVNDMSRGNNFITHIWFTGSDTHLMYVKASNSSLAYRYFVGSSSAIFPSFTYSSGTLTITVASGSGSQHFAEITDTYTLFYL